MQNVLTDNIINKLVTILISSTYLTKEIYCGNLHLFNKSWSNRGKSYFIGRFL